MRSASQLYNCISGISVGSTSVASVAAITCSTVTPGPVSSSVARPSGKEMTAISLTSKSMQRDEVSGSVQY